MSHCKICNIRTHDIVCEGCNIFLCNVCVDNISKTYYNTCMCCVPFRICPNCDIVMNDEEKKKQNWLNNYLHNTQKILSTSLGDIVMILCNDIDDLNKTLQLIIKYVYIKGIIHYNEKYILETIKK